MGSFNEICALSGLQIQPGTKVKCVFLTRNPYVDAGNKFAQRGCYHYDQWFLRTIPIDGVYDDYGRATFEDNYVVKLIEQQFAKDVVQTPWGCNQYHQHGTFENPSIDQLFELASQGRLRVYDGGAERSKKVELPEEYPTWQRVRDLIVSKKLKFMTAEGVDAYNAQHITDGVVFVDFNSYGDNKKKLEKVNKILAEKYDTKFVGKYKPEDIDGIIVAPKGAFKDLSVLHRLHDQDLTNALDNHPERPASLFNVRNYLPVLAVMIRDDVWQEYVKIKYDGNEYEGYNIPSVKVIAEQIRPLVDDSITPEDISQKELDEMTPELRAKFLASIRRMITSVGEREYFATIPFQITASCALSAKIENKKDQDDLIQRLAETARVERVMSWCQYSWHIPCLGGQTEVWDLKEKIAGIVKKIAKKERLAEENFDDEDDDK